MCAPRVPSKSPLELFLGNPQGTFLGPCCLCLTVSVRAGLQLSCSLLRANQQRAR